MHGRPPRRRRAVTAALAATAAVLLVTPAPRAMTPPCCAPVPPGLTAWWSGDDTSADRLGTHDGTTMGGTSFTPAEVRHGWFFDSTDDIVSVPDATDLWPGTGSFTVDAWVRTTDTAQPSDQVVRHYECAGFCPGSAAANWDLRVVAGKAWGFIRDEDNTGADAGGQVFDGTSSIADGAFHHLALVRDIAAGEGRLYVDGVVQDTEALNSGADGNLASLDGDANPVTIGGGILGGTNNPDANIGFLGTVDEVHWFLAALTTPQIASIFAAGPNGLCTDEVAPVSSATAPATGTTGSVLTISWTASDSGGSGLARVDLFVRPPGATGFTEVAAAATGAASGSFAFIPASGPGDYAFYTRAEDANCGREDAPASPDALTKVADPPPQAGTTTTPAGTVQLQPTPQQSAASPVVPPTAVAVTQIATLPSSHRCVSRRRFRIRLRKVTSLVAADIALNGTTRKHVKGKALGLPIDLRGLPRGTVTVAITVTTKTGQRLVGRRTYHTCVPRHGR